MSIDMDMGVPYLPDDLPGEEIRREERERRRIFLLGGAMNGMGSYMGPVYPMVFDPAGDEEEDPNP